MKRLERAESAFSCYTKATVIIIITDFDIYCYIYQNVRFILESLPRYVVKLYLIFIQLFYSKI